MIKRITWIVGKFEGEEVGAYNSDNELLGRLFYENVGRHVHWCWYQRQGIRMSPGCLQEVRNKQKELLKERRK